MPDVQGLLLREVSLIDRMAMMEEHLQLCGVFGQLLQLSNKSFNLWMVIPI